MDERYHGELIFQNALQSCESLLRLRYPSNNQQSVDNKKMKNALDLNVFLGKS
eukprot:UN04893